MPKKGTKQSKKVQKIEISDDEMSDNDSVASEPVDSDSETEIELKSSKKTKTSSKAKKAKKSDDEEQSKVESSFQELHDKFESFSEFNDSLKKLSNDLTTSIKAFKSLEKDVKKMFKQVQLEVGKEHKKLSKGKRKASGDRKKGGCVTKPTPVPDKIIKYLKLDDDAQFTRPEITAKLYQEFKERELSSGNRKNKMDKETAKLFGGKSGDEFHIHDFQRMLKKIYDSDPKTKKTSKKSQDSDGEEEEDL